MTATHTLTRRGLLAVSAAALATPAAALGAAEAEAYVTRLVAEVMALVTSGQPASAQAAAFRRLFAREAAVPQVAQFVVGLNWRKMSDAQKSAFQGAFLDYVARTYVALLGRYDGQTVKVTGSRDMGRRGVLVSSVANGLELRNASVEWLISDRGGAVKLIDVIVEGVSLLQTQRSEFSAMIDKIGRAHV